MTPNTGTSFKVTCGLYRNTCRYAEIHCANDMDCNIKCEEEIVDESNARATCRDSQMYGPTDHEFNVICHENNACQDSTIRGYSASKMDVSCLDAKACCDLTMYCPPNTNGNENCYLEGMPYYLFAQSTDHTKYIADLISYRPCYPDS